MTAPTEEPPGVIDRGTLEMQVVNLLARLDNALATVGPGGDLAKKIDHLDELTHNALIKLEDLAGVPAELAKVTGKLEEFGPLLERAKAMLNPGGIASAYVTGRRRGHRRDKD